MGGRSNSKISTFSLSSIGKIQFSEHKNKPKLMKLQETHLGLVLEFLARRIAGLFLSNRGIAPHGDSAISAFKFPLQPATGVALSEPILWHQSASKVENFTGISRC